jgi:hypothetical protein
MSAAISGSLSQEVKLAEEELLRRKSTKLLCEGRYAAQVAIEYWYDESWSPMMSIEDARKLDRVRLALRRADIAEAAKDGQVFELTPVAGNTA